MIDIKRSHAESVATLGNSVMRALVRRSPVDIGSYRGNHNFSVRSPDYSYDETRTDFNRKTKPNYRDPFQSLFISNGSPHAGPLENGHSGQAPNGVYGPTIRQFK